VSERPLAAASRRLRRPAGRPRRVTAGPTIGSDIQRAPSEAASSAAMSSDFAATLLPRGLPLPLASAYSGIPIRRLWHFIADGTIHPIRPPGVRRVLVDKLDLDELLISWKQLPPSTAAGADEVGDQTRGRS